MKKIRVLIVDDSAVVRQVLTALLGDDPAIEVIGSSPDPLFAMDRMARDWPDVIVLDVEMPRMDGITFLKQIMTTRPTPVVICSTLTEKGAATTMQALASGAVAIVTKPKADLKRFLETDEGDLVVAVKAAAVANVRQMRSLAGHFPRAVPASPHAAMAETTDRVVAMGTSTGGTQALELVLRALPVTVPGIVIVQHMPEKFTEAFARRLDGLCALEVKEGRTGDRVLPGRAIIAPGGRHMVLRRSGAQYQVEIVDAPPVNRHRPSVDVLFRSVAHVAGSNAMGVIMTGMGDDGARGLLEMRNAGAQTLGQDEASCVVYGMPKEAVRHGAVMFEMPLAEIPGRVAGFG